MQDDPHIVIDGVDMVYATGPRRLRALATVDLNVRRGEFVSIIGPSGCGKSTLLRIVGGLQTPSSGSVRVDGLPPREMQRSKQLGFVFQDPSLLPWRSVIDNVRLPLQVNRRGAIRPSRNLAIEQGPARPQALEGRGVGQSSSADPDRMVDLVGLTRFRDYYPHQLSGGMQQRVAIARSFVTRPSLLLMDEPFGALDEITRSAMRYELLRVWRSEAAQQCTVLFVTHSIAEAVLLSDRVIVLTPQPGRIAASLEIDLPRPRPEEIELEPQFIDYTRRLRMLLREHAPV